MILLVVLQNPWARGGLRKGWNPAVWLREMRSSRTGRRLALALPVSRDWEVRFVNASPRLGRRPSEPDLPHLRRALRRVQPDVVLACGRFALLGVRQAGWQGPLVAVPHPAFRLLTNELYRMAAEMIMWREDPCCMCHDRVELRQLRGRVQVEVLDGGRHDRLAFGDDVVRLRARGVRAAVPRAVGARVPRGGGGAALRARDRGTREGEEKIAMKKKKKKQWRVIVSVPTRKNRRAVLWNVGMFMPREYRSERAAKCDAKRCTAENEFWTFRALETAGARGRALARELTPRERKLVARWRRSAR